MKVLLDTHAFLWWVSGEGPLGAEAGSLLADGGNEVFLSVVSVWETVVKKKLKRLAVPDDVSSFIREEIAWYGLLVLPVSLEHSLRVYELRDHPTHKDPFDRMLAAQALSENLTLISGDRAFDHYGVQRIW